MYATNNFYTQDNTAEVIPFTSFDAPTSYVDANDLAEVLEAFFQGTLDNVDEYLPRLHKGLGELHPTNSLFGQLDSDTIRGCLYKLNKLDRAAIQYKFNLDDAAKHILSQHFFSQQIKGSFESWKEELYIQAIEMLSFEVLEVLD